jgi:UDP-N-acetylglucosamine--N-acetylmuramyl-(pentapeptide) pyrophosphoryl-undecaprenol N-acetylglucosamine transferase
VTYVIAAAGTGGHVYPALAVAEALTDRGISRDQILFLGGNRLAATAVPAAGFHFLGFELTRLHRNLSPQNFRIPIVLRRTSAAMADEILKFGGRVVLGMSGYVTVPAAMAARRAGIPFVLQEQNAHPGIAARFASRRAVTTFLGLPGRAAALPRSVLVGNPLRREIASFDRRALRQDARARYGVVTTAPVLGIVGGSQGARVLNQAASTIVANSPKVGSVIHLTGPDAFDEMSRRAATSSLPWICLPSESQMEYFYAAVDLVVCRSGAMTVSELAATGTPSLLVPLARVGQSWNAESLSAVGGAEIVAEGDVGSLPARIAALLTDEHGLAAMGRSARSASYADSAGVIADRLVEVANA